MMGIDLKKYFEESKAVAGDIDAKRLLDITFIGAVKGLAVIGTYDDLQELVKQHEALVAKIDFESGVYMEGNVFLEECVLN